MREAIKVFGTLAGLLSVVAIVMCILVPKIKAANERRDREGDWKEITLGGHTYFEKRSSNRPPLIHSLNCQACKETK